MSNRKPSPSPHGRSSHRHRSSHSDDRHKDYRPSHVSSYRGRSSDHYPRKTSAAVQGVGSRYSDSVFRDHRRVSNGWRSDNQQIIREQGGQRYSSHHNHHHHDTNHHNSKYSNSGGDSKQYGGSRNQDSSDGRLNSHHHHKQNDERSRHRQPDGYSYAGRETNDYHPNSGIPFECDQSFGKSKLLHPTIHDDDPSTITTSSNT